MMSRVIHHLARRCAAGRVVRMLVALATAAVVLVGCSNGAGQTPRDRAASPRPEKKEPSEVNEPTGPVRRPVRAGQFYPSDPDELRAEIRKYVDAAKKVKLPGRLIAVIAPHAGYAYSGPAAGWAYRQLEGLDVDTVVLIGGHNVFEHAAVMTSGAYLTPLGQARVEHGLARMMASGGGEVRDDFQTHSLPDHALEVHVPFIQVVLPKARIVPVYFNNTDLSKVAAVGRRVAHAVRGKKAVIVCSTDLSHYPPAEIAEKSDKALLEAVVSLDGKQIVEESRKLVALYGDRNESCAICCLGSVLATVEAAKKLGATGARVLRYDHSGNHVYKDRSRVVGYGAVAIYGAGPHQETRAQTAGGGKMVEGSDRMLSNEERKELLALARKSVETGFGGAGLPRPERVTPALDTKTGAFVTLRKHGKLRGCIGTFERSKPLWKVIGEFARNAAFEDTRFAPVTKDELAEIEFEISVLSPLKKTDDPLDIRLGTDGIWLVGSRGERGTFLPQVATETGWSKEKFLSYCASHKAGMPPDAWRDPDRCTVYTYTAEVFSEGEH